MAEKTLRVRSDFERPDSGIVTEIARYPVGMLVDALGRRGALAGIGPIGGNAEFCGTALTVWTVPGDNLGPWAAIRIAKPGDVIVIANGGARDASVFGDLAFGMARNVGVAAIVTDGLVRDVEGIDRVGLPVHAAGVSPNSPFKNGPAVIGETISIGAVVVAPGDLVRGDRDGVVVVPRVGSAEVLAGARSVAAKEAAIQRAIDAGARWPDWIDEIIENQVEWIGERGQQRR